MELNRVTLRGRSCAVPAGMVLEHHSGTFLYTHSPPGMQVPALDLSPLFCFADFPNQTRRVCRLPLPPRRGDADTAIFVAICPWQFLAA